MTSARYSSLSATAEINYTCELQFRMTLPKDLSVVYAGRSRMPVPRILVVDDDPDQRDLVRTVLESNHFEVVEAESGKVAAQAISSSAFDAVLTDLRMPEASGETLIQWIIHAHPHMRSRVLIVSGDPLAGGLDAFLSRAGFHILRKPYDLVDLVGAVNRILSRSA
jgi:DNA-binding NtrC family response regulator